MLEPQRVAQTRAWIASNGGRDREQTLFQSDSQWPGGRYIKFLSPRKLVNLQPEMLASHVSVILSWLDRPEPLARRTALEVLKGHELLEVLEGRELL